jgi:hypothetical protein
MSVLRQVEAVLEEMVEDQVQILQQLAKPTEVVAVADLVAQEVPVPMAVLG